VRKTTRIISVILAAILALTLLASTVLPYIV